MNKITQPTPTMVLPPSSQALAPARACATALGAAANGGMRVSVGGIAAAGDAAVKAGVKAGIKAGVVLAVAAGLAALRGALSLKPASLLARSSASRPFCSLAVLGLADVD